MQSEPKKLEGGKEKEPYQKPELRKHGTVEQITGFLVQLSGCQPTDPCF
jgi:hypothetical protein